MGFDVTDLLGSLFADGPTMAPAVQVMVAVVDDPPDSPDDPLAALPYADWVQRPDCHGRMGWEAPDLSEDERWWARCDFDSLPVVSEGFRFGDIQAPAHHDCAPCVAAGRVDTLDLDSGKPLQGQLRGFGGA